MNINEVYKKMVNKISIHAGKNIIMKSFLCGVIVRCLLFIMEGRFLFFSFSTGIPEYVLRRIPYGISSCILFGVLGVLVGTLSHLHLNKH